MTVKCHQMSSLTRYDFGIVDRYNCTSILHRLRNTATIGRKSVKFYYPPVLELPLVRVRPND